MEGVMLYNFVDILLLPSLIKKVGFYRIIFVLFPPDYVDL